jgi:hypothetical protein
MKRTTKKRRLTLDSLILITTEEKLINTEHTKMFELIGAGMAITDATLDRARKYEETGCYAKGVEASVPFGEILSGIHTGHSVFEK